MGGTGNDEGHAIAVAQDGSVYITGVHFGTGDFDPSAGTFNVMGGDDDIFLAKFLPDHAPTGVGLSASAIVEHQPVGAVVGAFSSTDPDAGETFTYTLVSGTGSDDNAAFTINSSGQLRTAAVFDCGSNSSYNIRVRTTDYNGMSYEETFTIAVIAAPGIIVTSTSGLTTSEAGGTATFTVKLNTQPTADVTIGLSSSDATEGTVLPTSLTFTASNWNTPQTVTVTGVDDQTVDGSVAYTILTAAATSTDANYNGLDAADVSLTNTDNDIAGITVTPTSGLLTSETGGIATFTIRLDTQPAADVTIGLSSTDTTEGTVSPASLTFTSSNWNTPQTVTVTGVDDLIADGSVAYTILTGAAVSTDTNYSGLDATDVAVTNADNEVQTLVLSTGTLAVGEGSSNTFTVKLAAQPTSDVTVTAAQTAGDSDLGVTGGATLTFTIANWNTPQTVTIGAAEDADAANGTATIAVTSSGLTSQTVTATEVDNDTVGIMVTPTSGLVTSESGATATFTVQLSSQPIADVTIALSSSDTTEGTVAPASLTFTSSNWNAPQVVTITGVDDQIVDGSVAYTIQAAATSSDTSYNGLNAAEVSVTNDDNDVSAPMITVLNGSTMLVNGATTPIPFGTAYLKKTGSSITFTVRNDGSQTVTLTTPFVSASHFTVSEPITTSLTPGQTTTFTVTLNNSIAWSGSEQVSLASDGGDFSFLVSGTVTPLHDFSTPGLYDPAASRFYVRNANSTGIANTTFDYGPAGGGWIPLSGDWDGNGTDTVGLYNPATSTFYLRNKNTTGIANMVFDYGPADGGWIPLAGDWDGNGSDTVALYNPTTSTFYLRNTNTTGIANITFGYGPARRWLEAPGWRLERRRSKKRSACTIPRTRSST